METDRKCLWTNAAVQIETHRTLFFLFLFLSLFFLFFTSETHTVRILGKNQAMARQSFSATKNLQSMANPYKLQYMQKTPEPVLASYRQFHHFALPPTWNITPLSI